MAVKGEPPCGSFSNKQPLMSKTIYLEGKNMKNSLLEFSLMGFSSYFMMVVFQWIIVDKVFLLIFSFRGWRFEAVLSSIFISV